MVGSKTLKYIFHSGKNSKQVYYIRNFLRLCLLPDVWYRSQRNAILQSLDNRPDKEYILSRVDYYCRLAQETPLSGKAKRIADFHRKGHRSVYFFDSYEFVRYFPTALRWQFAFGDIRDLQDEPSIVKSRPLVDNNENSILLNMDKVRHFIFLNDKIPFVKKKDKAIFRGEVVGKPRRIEFLERWWGDPSCDVGEVGKHCVRPEWRGVMLTLAEHLEYKFVLSLEGNDVASNLKWVMSSNSLAVMPRPTCETWFMEGKLIPDYHYVEIKPDYSDLKERMEHFINHPDEAQTIIQHAHEWIAQFQDKQREKLISLLVFDKYFRMTGQSYLLCSQE